MAKEVGSAQAYRTANIRKFVLWAIAAAVVLWIVVATAMNMSNSPSKEGLAACSHFRNVAADQRRGILTDEQLLTKMQEVAAAATTSEIRQPADRAVRGLIAHDDLAAAAGVTALDRACTDAGH